MGSRFTGLLPVSNFLSQFLRAECGWGKGEGWLGGRSWKVGPLGEWRDRAVKVKQSLDDSVGPEGEFLSREEDLSVSPSIHSPRTIYLISRVYLNAARPSL